MKTQSDTPSSVRNSNSLAAMLKLAQAVIIFPLVMTILLFVAAGRLDWTWAWVYLVINLVNFLIVSLVVIRNVPVSAGQPEQKKEGTWDAGSVFFLLAMYIVLPLVSGLDARFVWSRDPSIAWHVPGAAALVVGVGLVSWAIIVNPFMWSEEAVQNGQTVCQRGPYRLVRHPSYAGMILQALGIPILLGTFWTLIPGFAAVACMVVATAAEDRALQAGLAGYKDYTRKVRFRLLPGIW